MEDIELMNRYFTGKREKITAYLRGFLDNVQKNFSAIHPLGADLIDRLFRFTAEGKMLRGALACLGYDLFRNSADDSMISLGAAIELFQSALLIHDDIMDRDVSRRGKPSLFYHYQQKALNENLSDAFHAGESLAICAGDAAFFLAYEILGKNPFPDNTGRDLVTLFSQELSYVSAAQMMDVYQGADSSTPPLEDILRLYARKTGRYTFSLPLISGAIAANEDPRTLTILENLGIWLGTIFQIKDDELGLFGETEKTGKPEASDVREGKKTLYYLFLAGTPEGSETRNILRFFGNKDLSTKEIQHLRDIIKESEIPEKISMLVRGFEEKARAQLAELTITNTAAYRILMQFIDYNLQRIK